MSSNVGGILVLAAAVFLIVMGIRGSQHALFPGLFGDTASSGVDTSNPLQGAAPPPAPGDVGIPGLPGAFYNPSSNDCPTGYTKIPTGVKDLYICIP